MSIKGFTPGEFDEERTDTIEAQRIGLGQHPITGEWLNPNKTEEEFQEAQGGLHKAADFLWDVGVNLPLFVGSGFNPQSIGSANALRDKLKGKKNIPWGLGINYGPNDGFGGWESTIEDVWSKDMNTFHTEKQTIIPKYSSGDIVQTKNGPLYRAKDIANIFFSMNPNYEAIEGSDELTPNFLSQWLKRAKTGEQIYHFDITGHTILNVPGMESDLNKTRYKQWLTQNLINRYEEASLTPGIERKRFTSNTDFYDSQGQRWRLVKADQKAVGPGQEYIPMPVSEIDSRKMKSENSSESDKILLKELMKLNVKERNALEKKHPWLIDWNSDVSGQNYHEHMIGLDETEFWKSAYGKSLGYMNNDVYILDKGLGNIVFLNDPKFKVMKDQVAEYITPSAKTTIYPGKKERTYPVKKFTAGKYKGLNAVIGYEADINSPNKSDLIIYAYDPSSTKNIGFKTEYTIPNYYSVLYAKKSDGTNLFPLKVREGILHSLVDSYLNDTPEMIVHLEDITEHVFKRYGINIDLKNPKALEQWYEDFGVISSDYKTDTSAYEKIFKTTPKNERLQKRVKKERVAEFLHLLDLAKNGKYKQLTLDLLYPDD